MTRQYGEEFPERPRMAVISDLLGIPHFTTSRGSTVRRDFLEAVGGALGVQVERIHDKDHLLAAVIEASTGEPMNASLLSAGGTVTNDALQAMIDGITAAVDRENPALRTEAQPADATIHDIEFNPQTAKDERVRRLRAQTIREGRGQFRSTLLDAYGGRCAITGFDAIEALEAAHIYPYVGPESNMPSNGLLLRADVHGLFDRGAMAICETTLKVLLASHLRVTRYADLEGVRIRSPKQRDCRPSLLALRHHRESAGL
jgi:hypothetical protein